jgi:hypothetical protein
VRSAIDLETALLAEVELAGGASVFACPDCDGDPDCPTCGTPSRSDVGLHLFGAWFRWLH